MTEIADLERRIRVLEDVEAIKKLKADYWYLLDYKLWDEFAGLFTEDMVFQLPCANLKVEGGKAFVQHVMKKLGPLITVHQGHQPRIELTSDTTARGRWALYDNLIDVKGTNGYTGRGYYEDEYRKEGGKWKISSSTLIRQFTGV